MVPSGGRLVSDRTERQGAGAFGFSRVPDVQQLCERSSQLMYPELAFDDRMYEALVEVVRCLPDDRWGHSIVAVAHCVFGTSRDALTSISTRDWPDAEDQVLAGIRACHDVNAARAYLDLMDQPTVNEDWRSTSRFLHLVNPGVFPIWNDRIALHFGLAGHRDVNSGHAYRSWLAFASDAVERHERLIQQSVQRHLVINVPPIRAVSLLLSWFGPIPSDEPANLP